MAAQAQAPRGEERVSTTRDLPGACACLRSATRAYPRNLLAASLNNLAGELGVLGRHQEALAAAEEAVAIWRMFAAARPTALPDLATALGNLALQLAGVGRREEALAAAEEAVVVRR